MPNSDIIIGESGVADTSETGTPLILARLSQAYDMLNQIVVDACFVNYRTGEHELAEWHIGYMQKGDMLLFDRNCASFWMFALLLSKGMHFCTRLKVGSWKLVTSGEKEMTAEIHASKASNRKCKKLGLESKSLKLRFVCIELDAGEKAVLVTSLLDEIE